MLLQVCALSLWWWCLHPNLSSSQCWCRELTATVLQGQSCQHRCSGGMLLQVCGIRCAYGGLYTSTQTAAIHSNGCRCGAAVGCMLLQVCRQLCWLSATRCIVWTLLLSNARYCMSAAICGSMLLQVCDIQDVPLLPPCSR
jgi:hypothetical protein